MHVPLGTLHLEMKLGWNIVPIYFIFIIHLLPLQRLSIYQGCYMCNHTELTVKTGSIRVFVNFLLCNTTNGSEDGVVVLPMCKHFHVLAQLGIQLSY